MNTIAQKIAILTFLGFTGLEPHPDSYYEGRLRYRVAYPEDTAAEILKTLPQWHWLDKDPLRDLNVMAEALRKINGPGDHEKRSTYQRWLFQILWLRQPNAQDRYTNLSVWGTLTASAAQQAEAFLRTMDLWVD